MESMGTEVGQTFRFANARLKPCPTLHKMNKKGYTLIEVVLAVMVTAIAVAATLVVMSKMIAYTGTRGDAFDIANAVMVSQYAMDKVRDQRFPPTGSYGDLKPVDASPPTPDPIKDTDSFLISNTTYTYETTIVGYDLSTGTTTPVGTVTGTIEDYDDSTTGDSMLGYRNLLQVTVLVKKGSRPILQTVTYKTRNGYY